MHARILFSFVVQKAPFSFSIVLQSEKHRVNLFLLKWFFVGIIPSITATSITVTTVVGETVPFPLFPLQACGVPFVRVQGGLQHLIPHPHILYQGALDIALRKLVKGITGGAGDDDCRHMDVHPGVALDERAVERLPGFRFHQDGLLG